MTIIPVDECAGGDPDPHAGQLEVDEDDVVADGVHGQEEDEGAAEGVRLRLAQAALVRGEEGEEADDYHSLEFRNSAGSNPRSNRTDSEEPKINSFQQFSNMDCNYTRFRLYRHRIYHLFGYNGKCIYRQF